MIEGLKIIPKKIISTPDGPVYHMLKSSNEEFKSFGEIYFSEIFPGKIKAWKRHSRMTCYLTVPSGRVKFAVYDPKKESATFGKIEEFELGPECNYSLAVISPGLWFGFANYSSEKALLVNCASLEHDPAESEKLSANSPEIPYKW